MAGVNEAQLVRNGDSSDHLKALHDLLETATSISMAVAFLKSTGLGKIIDSLRSRLAAGAAVELFIGRDFCLTEPEALKELLDQSKRHRSCEVFLAKADPRSTFHPKLYLGLGASEARVLMGSANLTGGALAANEEISLSWKLGLEDALLTQLQEVFATYRSKDRFEELDDVVLEQYRRQFKIAQDAKRRIEKEMASADSSTFDLATLTSLHEEFSQSGPEVQALEKRRRDRKRARLIQRQIAKMNSLSNLTRHDRDEFAARFRDLITSGDGHSHLWHSGDIHRRGQAALKQPRKTIALFSLAEDASKLPPEEGYARLRAPAGEIKGVGINMVSEILCTFAPKRYAVFNGNTAAALRVIGAEPPKSVSLFSPETYARICGIVDAVRRRTGGEDLSDADAFLNWIYQSKVKRAS
jgi:HKD family nuclease